ncbi:MAG: hypothetical protein ABIH82_02030, partial [Candidatus Woesearchaeota archaeon]
KKMVYWKEKISRYKQYFRFNNNEITGLAVAALLTGFIFSFRDWGGASFNFLLGIRNMILAILAAGLLFFVRVSLQKLYGLSGGYKVEFKPLWGGIIGAVILAFVTNGLIPIILIGGTTVIFISKHRMGEYRYGFSYWNNGIISMWAIYAAIIMGCFFGLGAYIFPSSYFFSKGLIMSMIMGFLSLLPIPQMEAYSIYYAAPWLYLVAILIMIIVALLLLTKTLIGLMVCIVIGLIFGFIYFMIGSEK